MNAERPLSSGFIRLYTLAFLFFSAGSVLTVILPLRSEADGMRQAEIGLMMGATMLVCMFVRPWAGQMVARHGALKVMRLLLIGHACCLVLYIISGTGGLIWIRAFQGALIAFFSMALQIGIVEQLRDQDRAQGQSLYSLSTMLPQLFGPVAALYVWENNQTWLFAVMMIVLAAVTWLVGFSVPLPNSPLKGTSFTFMEMVKAVSEIGRSRGMLVCTVVMLLASCMFSAVSTYLPLYMVSTGHGNAGLYFMIQAGVVVVFRFTLRKKIPSDGQWHPGLIAGMLLSEAVGTLMLTFLREIGPFVYISALFNGLAVAILYPTLTTYLSFVLPAKTRHILLGLFMSSYDLGFALGGLVMGVAVEWLSYSGMFTICALIGAAALMTVLTNWNRMKISEA